MKHKHETDDVQLAQRREAPAHVEPAPKRRIGVSNQALIVGVLAAIGGWFLHVLSERNERDAALPELPKRSVSEVAPTFVTVAPATVRSISQTIEAIGTLSSFEEISISSKVDGNVLAISHDVGDRVVPGAVLMEIDSENYRLAVEQAERSLHVELAKLGLREPPVGDWDVTQTPNVVQATARLDQAANRWERLQKLSSAHATSEADLVIAKGEFETARAERDQKILMAQADLATIKMKQTALEIAKRQLNDTKILAPPAESYPELINGELGKQPLFVVSQRAVAEGTFLRMGTNVCTLVIDRMLKLRASIPERFGTQVAIGQSAAIRTAAVADPLSGTVTNVHPTVDPKTRTFQIEIQIPNADGRLKPGNFAKAELRISQRENATVVPLESIVGVAGINKLFVMEDSKAREVQVKLGSQTNEWVEILEPQIPPDAQIITSGQSPLSTGSPVRVRESSVPAQTSSVLSEPTSSEP